MMMNTFLMPVQREMPVTNGAGPDAISRRTAEPKTGTITKDFKEFLKSEPVENRESGRPENSRTENSRIDRTEQDRRPEQAAQSDRTEKTVERKDQTVERKDRNPADEKQAVAKTNGKKTPAGQAGQADEAKKAVVHDVVAFLEKNKVKASELSPGTVKAKELKEIEKALLELGDKDLKDLKRFLEAAKSAPGQAQVFRQLTAFVRDKVKDQGLKGSKSDKLADPAFRVEFGEQGRKIYVNKNKIQVIDQRTAMKEHLRQSDAGTQVQAKTAQPEQATKKETVQTSKFDQWLTKEGQVQRDNAAGPARQAAAHDLRTVNQAFNDLVKWSKLMLDDKKSVMQIDLKPDHLGRIMLKIEMVDNKLSAQIFAQNQGTSDMFKQNMSDLQNAFKQAGLSVEKFDVNVASNAGGFAGGEERSFGGQFRDDAPQGWIGRPAALTGADYDTTGLLSYGLEAERGTVNYIV